MVFQSIDFVIFLVVLFAVYWLVGRRLQNLLLLTASYLFYGYVHPWLLLLLFGYTVVHYSAALGMTRFPARKKEFLIASVAASLAALGVFKYFNFFVDNVNALFAGLGVPTFANNLNIFLPIGISFFAFQGIGYTFDVYKGKIEARKSFIDFALFKAFFPQLVAGPIERAGNLLPQFERRRTLSPAAARDGLVLIIWGFFKKLVIADNVAFIANKVFLTEDPGFGVLWAGVFAFCIQIYADFSGYTDIARGAARLFGFDLIQNFDHPYLAQSPTDFWRRWHISLSSWFRDYVYIPLGGSRSGPIRNTFNLLFTFLLTGFWHGASWNFIVWGLYHGTLILLHRMCRGLLPESVKANRVVGVGFVLFTLVLVNIGWLIFRETDFHYVLKYLTLSPLEETRDGLRSALFLFFTALIYSLPLWAHPAFEYVRLRQPTLRSLPSSYKAAFSTATATALFAAILMMSAGSGASFLYFQF